MNPAWNPIRVICKSIPENARYEVEAGKAQLKQIDRSSAPRLEFWVTTYARGSSIHTNGSVNISDGWMFSRYNYGVGVQLVFPLLDLANYKYNT